jgi:tripartite motif-containing protein 2/3/tripartite motif-containing protein 71
VDAEGNGVVTEYNHRVQVFRPHGSVARSFDSRGVGLGQLQTPVGVAVDVEGKILVAEYGNGRVQIF